MAEEKKDAKDAGAKKGAKETKRILRDVIFHDRTYRPGDEDDLEERLTQDEVDRLAATEPATLAGEWSPGGKGGEPMENIPPRKVARAEKDAQAKARKAGGSAGHSAGHHAGGQHATGHQAK